MKLETLTPREASIFACLCDTIVAPGPALPPVQQTDAVEFLDRWLGLAPRLNRTGLRALPHTQSGARAPMVVNATAGTNSGVAAPGCPFWPGTLTCAGSPSRLGRG